MASMYNNDSEEFRKRMLKILSEEKQQYDIGQCVKMSGIISGTTYVCQQPEYVNAYDSQGRSCAKVSSSYQQRQSDYDAWSNATITALRNDNQQLRNAMQGAVAKNAQLIDEINRLRHENAELKAKKEKKKDFDVKVYNSLNTVGNKFTSIYQKFITWLNT